MPYPKLTPWPFIDPDQPPESSLKVGESIDRARSKTLTSLWHFFVDEGYLIVVKKLSLGEHVGEPGLHSLTQYEYPIAGARWFVDTVERFLLPPDHSNAVPRGEMTVEENVDGETIGVTRGAAYGGQYVPGYSFDNLNRIEHSTATPEGPYCQMFKMGDPWLFQDGLFDLFKEIAERHEKGEF